MEKFNMLKALYNSDDKQKQLLVKVPLFAMLVLIFTLIGAVTVHKVDQTVAGAPEVEIQLEQEVRDDYEEQILDFIQYDNSEKLIWLRTTEKRGSHYVYIFDGYTENIFVFRDGELSQYGSNTQGNLIAIENM